MMKFFTLALAATASLFFSACSVKDQNVTLGYNKNFTQPSADNGTIYIDRFVDKRKDKDRIGIIKTMQGKEDYASVYSQNGVTQWLESALQKELQARGFTVQFIDVSDTEKAEYQYSPLIDGEILKLFVEPSVGIVSKGLLCEMEIRMSLYKNHRRYTKTYTSNEKSSDIGGIIALETSAKPEEYKKVLEKNLSLIMDSFMIDIKNNGIYSSY